MCFDLGIGLVCGFNALCCVKSNCWCLENWKRWRCDTWVYFATLLSGELFGFCLGDWSFVVEGRLICCGKMSLKSIVRELKEMRDGIGSMSRRGVESRRWNGRTKSHVAPDVTLTSLEPIQQGHWANLPPELLLDIIRRVEDSETTWPARAVVALVRNYEEKFFSNSITTLYFR